MFGQYPLQVNGFKDLHECLEAAMIEGEIESLHSDNSGKSGQEVSSAFSLSSYLPFPFKWPNANLRFYFKGANDGENIQKCLHLITIIRCICETCTEYNLC